MKELLLVILSLSISIYTICQMNEITQIKYQVELKIEEKDYEYEVAEVDLSLKFKSEEERIKAEEEKIEEEKFAEGFSNFWREKIEKENHQFFTYTFDKYQLKYERSQNRLPNEFIRIFTKSGKMQHFYLDEKTKSEKLTEFILHHNPDSSEWKVDYEIKSYKSETKTILGYECFKVNIKQIRINEKENWKIVDRYELFVTDKINLPARLVIHLWEPVIEYCALEIKSVNVNNPTSYSIQRAVEIKKRIDESEIKLPEKYEDLLKKN